MKLTMAADRMIQALGHVHTAEYLATVVGRAEEIAEGQNLSRISTGSLILAMAEKINVNEMVDRMYENWVSGWVRCDPSNSYEESTHFSQKAEFDAFFAKLQAQGRGECESFYRCPLCGGESNRPLFHILDFHTEATRVWESRSGKAFSIYLPGEGGYDPLHRIGEELAEADPIAPDYTALAAEVATSQYKDSWDSAEVVGC